MLHFFKHGSRGLGPKLAQRCLRFLRPSHAQPRASRGCCRASDPVAHNLDHFAVSASFTSSAGVTARTATLGPRPSPTYGVPHRYLRIRDQVGRALREGMLLATWCPEASRCQGRSRSSSRRAPTGNHREKATRTLTPHITPQPAKRVVCDVVPGRNESRVAAGKASLECAPGLLAGDVVTRGQMNLKDVFRDLAGALSLPLSSRSYRRVAYRTSRE